VTVALSDERTMSIKEKCENILNLQCVAIREFAQLIGKLVSDMHHYILRHLKLKKISFEA
jgi:hypothetical protein